MQILETFPDLKIVLQLWDPIPDIMELHLRNMTPLGLALADSRRPELHITDIRSPGKDLPLGDPLDLPILEDIIDLPHTLEDREVLLGDAPDLLADPGVELRNLVCSFWLQVYH